MLAGPRATFRALLMNVKLFYSLAHLLMSLQSLQVSPGGTVYLNIISPGVEPPRSCGNPSPVR